MVRLLSEIFRSSKPIASPKIVSSPKKQDKLPKSPSKLPILSDKASSSRSRKSKASKCSSKDSSWVVYLILSTAPPIKTYVGVTNNFSRRLKQHNGGLKGGAKATGAGRPWISACLVEGFSDRSKACEFESRWKITSRKLPRKRNKNNGEQSDEPQLLLLQHRFAALNQVKGGWNVDKTLWNPTLKKVVLEGLVLHRCQNE